MYQDYYEQIKKYAAIWITLIVLLVGAGLYGYISTAGKYELVVQTIPENADIYINGNKQSKSTFLKPGTYSVVVKSDGYFDNSQVITVNSREVTGAILKPDSETATKEYEKNLRINKNVESVASLMSSQNGKQFTKDNPITADLPYENIKDGYSIDYSFKQNKYRHVTVEISSGNPIGRQKALSWIKQKGYNLSQLTIVFEDFNNPTSKDYVYEQ